MIRLYLQDNAGNLSSAFGLFGRWCGERYTLGSAKSLDTFQVVATPTSSRPNVFDGKRRLLCYAYKCVPGHAWSPPFLTIYC